MHTQGGSRTVRAHTYVADAKVAYTSIMTCTCGSVVTPCHLTRHSTTNAFMHTTSYRNKRTWARFSSFHVADLNSSKVFQPQRTSVTKLFYSQRPSWLKCHSTVHHWCLKLNIRQYILRAGERVSRVRQDSTLALSCDVLQTQYHARLLYAAHMSLYQLLLRQSSVEHLQMFWDALQQLIRLLHCCQDHTRQAPSGPAG